MPMRPCARWCSFGRPVTSSVNVPSTAGSASEPSTDARGVSIVLRDLDGAESAAGTRVAIIFDAAAGHFDNGPYGNTSASSEKVAPYGPQVSDVMTMMTMVTPHDATTHTVTPCGAQGNDWDYANGAKGEAIQMFSAEQLPIKAAVKVR